MKQLKLFKSGKIEHGGRLSAGKRNTLKPLHTKKSVHLVLKTKGEKSLYKNRDFVQKTIQRQAGLAGVKLYGLSIQHDHIHHSILFSDRSQYKKFVRSVTGLLARRFGRGLWKYRPYTKVVEWGRQLNNLRAYIEMNELEVRGVIPYQPRGRD